MSEQVFADNDGVTEDKAGEPEGEGMPRRSATGRLSVDN
jgi:hypothetical protein